MSKRVCIVVFFLLIGVYADIDFGNVCDFNGDSVNCLVPLVVDDCSNTDQLTGHIISPRFPALTNRDTELGLYRATISSCQDSLITLTLIDEEFSLGTVQNTFRVGDGTTIGSNEVLVMTGMNGVNELPNGQLSYTYKSSTNGIWMEFNLPEGRAMFKIRYDIIPKSMQINYYNESSGVITSSNYDTSTYPSDEKEELNLIDVSDEFGEYVDLLLTVNDLDIKGTNGDYLKIGPGLDPLVWMNSALLSWRVGKGHQFLIDGPRAHLLFMVMTPIDTSLTARGFSISYTVIEKNLTTVAPSTTPHPTSPTPLPFDPNLLQTELVYKNYENETVACLQLADVLQKYAESSGMLQDGSIIPELSESTIEMVSLTNCYHGWNVDAMTCGQVQVIVRAFYKKGESDDVTLAFPEDKVKEAVRQYGHLYDIVLPEDLLDLYWVIGGVALGVVILVGIGLLLCWRQKIRQDYSKKSNYQELPNNQLFLNSNNDVIKDPTSFNNRFEIGVDNPTFVIDDDEDRRDRPVMTYDPDRGTRIYSRSNSTQDRGYYGAEPEMEKTAAAAVLNVSPITSNFQWQAAQDNNSMSSIMPSLAAAPKRGILKATVSSSPTVRDFPTSFMAEDFEDVLYDNNNALKEKPQRRQHFPSSSSSSSSSEAPSSTKSSRKNSISTDQQISSHVVYGITLNDMSDDENETNL